MQAKFSQELCLINQLGWVNQTTGEANVAFITSQLNTLPPTVAAQLGFDAVSQCAAVKLQEITQDPNIVRCAKTYTAAQVTALQTMAADVFSFQCLGEMIQAACHTFVDQTYLQPLRNSVSLG